MRKIFYNLWLLMHDVRKKLNGNKRKGKHCCGGSCGAHQGKKEKQKKKMSDKLKQARKAVRDLKAQIRDADRYLGDEYKIPKLKEKLELAEADVRVLEKG